MNYYLLAGNFLHGSSLVDVTTDVGSSYIPEGFSVKNVVNGSREIGFKVLEESEETGFNVDLEFTQLDFFYFNAIGLSRFNGGVSGIDRILLYKKHNIGDSWTFIGSWNGIWTHFLNAAGFGDSLDWVFELDSEVVSDRYMRLTFVTYPYGNPVALRDDFELGELLIGKVLAITPLPDYSGRLHVPSAIEESAGGGFNAIEIGAQHERIRFASQNMSNADFWDLRKHILINRGPTFPMMLNMHRHTGYLARQTWGNVSGAAEYIMATYHVNFESADLPDADEFLDRNSVEFSFIRSMSAGDRW